MSPRRLNGVAPASRRCALAGVSPAAVYPRAERFARPLALLLFMAAPSPAESLETIRVPSADATLQPARLYIPPGGADRRPLLLWLHTWGGNYQQDSQVDLALDECRRRGWIFVQPDFRGRNNRPEACGSKLALQDLLDAIRHVQDRTPIDASRIYLLGVSGGGHMALLAAGRFPSRWSAVSAWVPISDLAAWHADSRRLGNNYWQDIEKCCGGPPSDATIKEYRRRSPLTHLAAAAGVPIHINAGIHDGHTGSVPIRHSLLAFNVLAGANGRPAERFTDESIEYATLQQKVSPLTSSQQAGSMPAPEPAAPDMQVLLHRTAGPAEVTLFEGGHEMRVRSAFAWLATQRRATREPAGSPSHPEEHEDARKTRQ